MRNLLILFFSVYFSFFPAINTFSSDGNPAGGDSLTIDNPKSKHSLFSGFGYGSNILLSGVSLSGNQAYLSSDLLYVYKNKWSVSAVFYNLPGITPTFAFYDLSLGFNHSFNSYFDTGLSLSQYFTANKLKDEFFGDFTYLTLSLGLDWRLLYTQAVFSTMLNRESTSYFQVTNSHYFSTPYFFIGKAYFSFEPAFNLLYGNRYYKHYKYIRDGWADGQPGRELVTYYLTSFGLMDLEVSVPVSFNIGNFTFEFEPLYHISIHKDPDFPENDGFLFFLNAFLKII